MWPHIHKECCARPSFVCRYVFVFIPFFFCVFIPIDFFPIVAAVVRAYKKKRKKENIGGHSLGRGKRTHKWSPWRVIRGSGNILVIAMSGDENTNEWTMDIYYVFDVTHSDGGRDQIGRMTIDVTMILLHIRWFWITARPTSGLNSSYAGFR